MGAGAEFWFAGMVLESVCAAGVESGVEAGVELSAVSLAAGAGLAGAAESGAVAAAESSIFSLGMTCAMPSSARSRRSVSLGYFVFHSATSFPSGLTSMTEKRRVIDASSMARIRSMD